MLIESMHSINGWFGIIAMGLTVVTTQVFIFLFEKNVINFSGLSKIILVNVLTILSGVLCLTLSGLTFSAALFHSQTLAMVQVFFNQVWRQYEENK